jgi:hypothetical protein
VVEAEEDDVARCVEEDGLLEEVNAATLDVVEIV